METILVLLVAFIFFLCCYAAYFKIRPLFPVHVNCWFCSHGAKVPYGNRNCWDCPNCEQYNGFTSDGGYNKPVPAQYTEEINHPVSCNPTEFLTHGEFLCRSCQRNQLLKIKQLAAFEPLNEAMYDEEISYYQKHLESVYALCLLCEATVQAGLRRMDAALQQQHSQSSVRKSQLSDTPSEEVISPCDPSRKSAKHCLRLCTVSTAICATLLVCSELCLHFYMEYSKFEGYICQLLQDNLIPFVLSVCGLSVCITTKLLLGKDRLFLQDAVHIIVWLIAVLASLPESQLISLVSQNHRVSLQLAFSASLLILDLVISFSPRHHTNVTTPVIKRLSLEGSSSSANSEAQSEAVSSVSTSCRRRLIPNAFHDDGDQLPYSHEKVTSNVLQQNVPEREHFGATFGVKQTAKSELDLLGTDLGGFNIGHPPSESGYSTGTGSAGNSVFGQGTFTTKSSVGFGTGVTFPRPLISPARLSHVRFSQSAEKTTLTNGIPSQNAKIFSSSQLGKLQSRGHHNIFLAQDARPHSMFAMSPLQHEKLTKEHLRSSFHRGQDGFGKAPSFTGLSLKEPHHPVKLKETAVYPIKNSLPVKKLSNNSWWRESSDAGECLEEEKTIKAEIKLDGDLSNDVECDSTTPDFSPSNIPHVHAATGTVHSTNGCMHRGVKPVTEQKMGLKESKYVHDLRNSLEVSDDEDGMEDVLDSSSVCTVFTKSGRDFSCWLIFAVGIAVVSLATNLLLAWSVFTSQ